METKPNRAEIFFRKLAQRYAIVSVVFMSLVLFVVFFNLFIATGNNLLRVNPVVKKYGINTLSKAYPDKNKDQIVKLLDETWSNTPLIFQGYVQFQEKPKSGKYMNISPDGFRQNGTPKSLPPNKNAFTIFLFGGSTAFGYGVSDDETIPHFLEAELKKTHNVSVYNFARGSYFSTQERILFELLLENYKPDMVIFIDGLNDFSFLDGQPEYSRYMKDTLQFNFYVAQKRFFRQLPMIDFFRNTRDLIFPPQKAEVNPLNMSASEKNAKLVLKRYLFNKKMIEQIATANRIPTLFVWQPIPDYPEKLAGYLFRDHLPVWPERKIGYDIMKNKRKRLDNFLWAADVGKNIEPAYVDMVHYSKDMNKALAVFIADELLKKHQNIK